MGPSTTLARAFSGYVDLNVQHSTTSDVPRFDVPTTRWVEPGNGQSGFTVLRSGRWWQPRPSRSVRGQAVWTTMARATRPFLNRGSNVDLVRIGGHPIGTRRRVGIEFCASRSAGNVLGGGVGCPMERCDFHGVVSDIETGDRCGRLDSLCRRWVDHVDVGGVWGRRADPGAKGRADAGAVQPCRGPRHLWTQRGWISPSVSSTKQGAVTGSASWSARGGRPQFHPEFLASGFVIPTSTTWARFGRRTVLCWCPTWTWPRNT